MSSGTKCGRIGCGVRTEGVVTGRVRSLSSRSGRLPRIAEIPLQGLTSTVALAYASVLGSLSCLPMLNGGGFFFPLRNGTFCVQKMGRLLHITNDCRLRSWGASRLGAHTNLDRAWKGCVYANVGIIVAVTEGVFMSDRQVD